MQPQPPQQEKVPAFLQVAHNLLALAQLRASLFATEFVEEVEHTKHMFIAAIAAAVFIAIGLVFAGLCAVVVFWETYRVAAVFSVTLVYLAIGCALLIRARKLGALRSGAFAETRRELSGDLMMFSDPNEHK